MGFLILFEIDFIVLILYLSEAIFGKDWKKSTQFWIILIGSFILIFLSFFWIFKIPFCLFYIYDNFINSISKNAVNTMFSNIIMITLTSVGIIGIIWSIIFGNLYVYYKKDKDRSGFKRYKKKEEYREKVARTIRQGIAWIGYFLYFLIFMLLFFIIPLYNKLGNV